MILDFDIIKKNIKSLKSSKKNFIQIEQYEKKEISWGTISNLELCHLANFNSSYKDYKNMDILLGKREVKFDELKQLMIDTSIEILPRVKEISASDWQDDTKEVEEYESSLKLIKKITPDSLENYLKTEDGRSEIFPNLYRIEQNIMDTISEHLFNYVVFNKLDIGEVDAIYEFEYFVEEIEDGVPSESEFAEKKRKIENSEKLINDVLNLINKSGSVNYKYFQEELKNKLKKLNKKEVKRVQKINDTLC